MRKIFAYIFISLPLLLVASFCFGVNVPEFKHKDSITQREFENVGQEIKKARLLPEVSTGTFINNTGTSDNPTFSVYEGTFTHAPVIPNANATNQAAAFGQLPRISFSSTTVQKTTTSSSFQRTDLASTVTARGAGSYYHLLVTCDWQIAAAAVSVFGTIYAGQNRNLSPAGNQGLTTWLNQGAATNRVPMSMTVVDPQLITGTTNYYVMIRNSDGASTIALPSGNVPSCTFVATEYPQ